VKSEEELLIFHLFILTYEYDMSLGPKSCLLKVRFSLTIRQPGSGPRREFDGQREIEAALVSSLAWFCRAMLLA
jgi:hypothetical protein